MQVPSRLASARQVCSPTLTIFMGFIGALALALGLSFGLGARETAGQIVSECGESFNS